MDPALPPAGAAGAPARAAYAAVLARFPLAADAWHAAVALEMREGAFGRAATLFQQCLLPMRDAALFGLYLDMVGACPGGDMPAEFEFAIAHAADPAAGRLYARYIAHLRAHAAPAPALRRVYQLAVARPHDGVEALWDEYCRFEADADAAQAETLLAALRHKYVAARATWRARAYHLRNLPRRGLPRRDPPDAARWRAYLAFEKGNPERLAPDEYYRRVCYAHDYALAALYLDEAAWHEAARFCADSERADDALAYYRRGAAAVPAGETLHFLYAEFCEDRGLPDRARAVYASLLARAPTPLAHIQYMRFELRAHSVPRARAALVAAIADPAGAGPGVAPGARPGRAPARARAVLNRGLERHAGESAYVAECVALLMATHDDACVRAVLDRAVAATPPARRAPPWEMYAA